MKAIWNGAVLAESDDTVVVEGNHYFPEEALDASYLEDSDRHTVCHWKGVASYYNVVVDGTRLDDAVWYYPDPSPAADSIRGRVAFSRAVKVVRGDAEISAEDGPVSRLTRLLGR